MNKFLQSVKGASVAFGVTLLLSSAPVLAQDTGLFRIGSAEALNSVNINLQIQNRDTFDLLGIRFDLRPTVSLGDGTPLIFDNAVGLFSVVSTGVASWALNTVPSGAGFGIDFTGFNFGDSFGFNFDPDIASNPAYGAVISELDGTLVTLLTSGGVVSGTLEAGTRLSASILSPIPEPEIYAMLAAGLGLMGFVARRRKQQLAAA